MGTVASRVARMPTPMCMISQFLFAYYAFRLRGLLQGSDDVGIYQNAHYADIKSPTLVMYILS